MNTNMTLIASASDEQLSALRAHAVNDVTREIADRGIHLSHAQADDLGEETLAWIGTRLGLTVEETDIGVQCRDRAKGGE